MGARLLRLHTLRQLHLKTKESEMGVILAIAIFAITYRFLPQGGVSPLWSLGISIIVTLLVYPIVVAQIQDFADALSSGGVASLLIAAIVVGGVAAGAYAIGHRNGASGGSPFKPF